MAMAYYCSIFLIIILAFQFFDSASSRTTKELRGMKRRGTVKTIESDGDVIDCVDFYKQPGFDHPLATKDMQMRPSSYPMGIKIDVEEESFPEIFQKWNEYGECPEGTVPIRRSTSSSNDTKYQSFPMFQSVINQSLMTKPVNGREYGMYVDSGSSYFGVHGIINVWNPKVEYGEYSAAKIWLVSQSLTEEWNSIEGGWIVYPYKYKNKDTRIYAHWAGTQSKGCFDLDCNGFIQTHPRLAIGASLKPVSEYDGSQFSLPATIFKDLNTGNWWLNLLGKNVGYWPKYLFKTLADHGNAVSWGGEIVNERDSGHHTTTEMGNGHFPSEGFKKAAYIRDLKVVDSNNEKRNPRNLKKFLTSLGCYDVTLEHALTGQEVIYGGPGFSHTCF